MHPGPVPSNSRGAAASACRRIAHASRLISHCARRQQRREKKWRSSRAFMVTTILVSAALGSTKRASSKTDSLPAPRPGPTPQALVRLPRVLHGFEEDLARLGRRGDARRHDEVAVGVEPYVPLGLLAVRRHPVPYQLVRAGPGYAVHREREAGVLQSAQMSRPHQAADQPPHVVLAHLRLEIGGAHRRVARAYPRMLPRAPGPGCAEEELPSVRRAQQTRTTSSCRDAGTSC